MNPIISPWFFYFVSVSNDIKDFLFVISLLLIITGIIFSVVAYAEDLVHITKQMIKVTIIGGICLLINSFIPSEELCYKMLAASLVTPDNIEVVQETGKDLIDYILETAEEFKSLNEEIKEE